MTATRSNTVLQIFKERELPLTAFACALALERNPPAAAALVKAGVDVCSHGWRWVKHYELGEEDKHAGVWVCRRIDIARHWIHTHPSRRA